MKTRTNTSGIFIALCLLFTLSFVSCTKNEEPASTYPSINNTTWKANVTITGNTIDQNIFEFSNDAIFSWHPVSVVSYYGTWAQNDATVTFTFKEVTGTGNYYWDNTATLSEDGTTLTGTMQRRGAQGSGTFTAKKL